MEAIVKILIYLRSLCFCLRYLPFNQARKIPILVGFKVSTLKFKGSIVLDVKSPPKGMVKLGLLKGTFNLGDGPSYLLGRGSIIFLGRATIQGGFRFSVASKGKIIIGDKVFINSNGLISSNTIVSIGTNSQLGWNCTILDGDGHNIINSREKNGQILNIVKPVILERCCWLSSCCTVTKGVTLAHHTIVPYGSIVNKSNTTPYVLFGGSPNKILKTDIVREDFVEG